MTERATGRHRAPVRSSSPLSTLTGPLSVVGDRVGSVRRSGVIIAMSSGLVASMALPAQAVTSPQEAAGPMTASIPVVPATLAGEAIFTAPEGGLLALPPDLAVDQGELTAPAAARVDFDRSSFSFVTDTPAPAPAPVSTPAAPSQRTADDADAADEADDDASARTGRRQVEAKPARPAAPAPAKNDTATVKKAPTSATAMGAKAVAIAYRYEGTPYVWGGTTPRGFDCSGFTRYVYAQLGKSLGRTVSDQRGDVKIVPRSKAQPGDLVFFGSSHIGIYLGNNMMIDSPRRGKSVTARKIYSANVQFGRVL